jgi:hypothetical protein
MKILSSYRIVDDAAFTVMQDDLLDRLYEFKMRLPMQDVRISRHMAIAVFAEAQDLLRDAREVAIQLGLPQSKIDQFDYSMFSYEEFEKDALALQPQVLKWLSKRSKPLFNFSSPFDMEIDGERILADPSEDAQSESGIAKWIGKLLAALGVKDVWEAILDVLETDNPELLRELGEAIAQRNSGRIKTALGRILRFFASRPFFKALAKRIGEKEAERVVGKILSKFVPFLGWAIFIGCFIYAIFEEFV